MNREYEPVSLLPSPPILKFLTIIFFRLKTKEKVTENNKINLYYPTMYSVHSTYGGLVKGKVHRAGWGPRRPCF